MDRFKGQTALITGGARGIGLGIAQRLGAEGASVALLDIDAALLGDAEKALAAAGVTALGIPCDVTEQAAVEGAVEAAVERLGRVDVLVTAAGITGQTNLQTHQVDPADFDRVMAPGRGSPSPGRSPPRGCRERATTG